MLGWNIGKVLCGVYAGTSLQGKRVGHRYGKGDLSPKTCIIDPTGKTVKLPCTCSAKLASTRIYRNCKYVKRKKPSAAIACDGRGRLRPHSERVGWNTPSPATLILPQLDAHNAPFSVSVGKDGESEDGDRSDTLLLNVVK